MMRALLGVCVLCEFQFCMTSVVVSGACIVEVAIGPIGRTSKSLRNFEGEGSTPSLPQVQ